MISWLRRNRQPFIITLTLVFIISIFVGLGGYYLSGANVAEAVAVVDGTKIPYMRFLTRLEQYSEAIRARGGEITPEMEKEMKGELLREMIVEEILASQAEKMGMRVSDRELALSIEGTPAFQQDGRFYQELYFRAVRYQLKTTPEQFERQRRRELLSNRLKAMMYRASKLVPSEGEFEYQQYLRTYSGAHAAKEPPREKAQVLAELRQRRAVDTINFFLRQFSTQADIRTFLEQRERGI
jgi:peptidyl-prolyl cis-trans isomerase D